MHTSQISKAALQYDAIKNNRFFDGEMDIMAKPSRLMTVGGINSRTQNSPRHIKK